MAKKEKESEGRAGEGLMNENEMPLVGPDSRLPKMVEFPAHNSVGRMGPDSIGAAEGATVLREAPAFKRSVYAPVTAERGSKDDKLDLDE